MADFKTIEHKKNPLLHREEYKIEIKSESNPSYADIIKFLGKDEKLIVIKRLKGNFGRKIFIADVIVYASEAEKNNVEVTPRKVRKAAKAAAVAAAQASSAPSLTK
jgi:ribosomal protein S24E